MFPAVSMVSSLTTSTIALVDARTVSISSCCLGVAPVSPSMPPRSTRLLSGSLICEKELMHPHSFSNRREFFHDRPVSAIRFLKPMMAKIRVRQTTPGGQRDIYHTCHRCVMAVMTRSNATATEEEYDLLSAGSSDLIEGWQQV